MKLRGHNNIGLNKKQVCRQKNRPNLDQSRECLAGDGRIFTVIQSSFLDFKESVSFLSISDKAILLAFAVILRDSPCVETLKGSKRLR